MTTTPQHSTEEQQEKAVKHAFIKKLIIGKVILLGVMGAIGYYLFLTI